jgi:hypothetical protein
MSLIFIISGIILFLIVHLLMTKSPQRLESITVLPNSFMILGIIILIACSIAPVIVNVNENSIYNEIKNLLILIGLVTICLSKEKIETESLNDLRFITLISSLIVVSFIYQTSLILNFFKLRESTGSQLTICTLATYLFVFHLNKRRLNKK